MNIRRAMIKINADEKENGSRFPCTSNKYPVNTAPNIVVNLAILIVFVLTLTITCKGSLNTLIITRSTKSISKFGI